MNKFKITVEIEVETSQFKPNMVGEIELRKFVIDELESLNGTEYVAEVTSCQVRLQ